MLVEDEGTDSAFPDAEGVPGVIDDLTGLELGGEALSGSEELSTVETYREVEFV